MRVISGYLRGRKMTPPEDMKIRPTTDRVRETLFNMLAHGVDIYFDEAIVGDFFAGTGALGIETISRGAKKVMFMDNSQMSLDLLRRNLNDLGLSEKARVIRGDARNLARATEPLNLIFLDPPYKQGLIPPVLEALKTQDWVEPGTVIVMEVSLGEDLPLPSWLEPLKDRTIGDVRLVIAEVTP